MSVIAKVCTFQVTFSSFVLNLTICEKKGPKALSHNLLAAQHTEELIERRQFSDKGRLLTFFKPHLDFMFSRVSDNFFCFRFPDQNQFLTPFASLFRRGSPPNGRSYRGLVPGRQWNVEFRSVVFRTDSETFVIRRLIDSPGSILMTGFRVSSDGRPSDGIGVGE